MAIDNKDKKVLKSSIEREQNELACSAEREKIKGSKNLNVPPLRFPEFSGEWKSCYIKDILSIGNGRDYKHLSKGNIPVFGTGGYMTSVNDYLHDGETTFIGRKGTINKPFYYNGKFWTVDTLFYTHSFIDTIPRFIYCLFQTINWLRYNEASGVPSLSKDTIEKIKVCIPNLEEQAKIATLLRLIDERIVTQNKIIDKLQSLIKGLNDHILKNIEGDQVCFADLGEAYGGLSGKSGDDFGCGDPFITYMNVYQNTYISENDYELVQIVPDEKQNSVQYGEALFTLSSETPEEVGMGAVYLGKSQKLYLNSFCFGVHFHGNRVLPQYIAHFISSTSFRKAIYPLAQGSTRFNLQKQDFMRMKFVLPSLEEQERIATALDALHNHLANEKLLTEQYLLLKQFLLQQMFI